MKGKRLISQVRRVAGRVTAPIEKLAARALEHQASRGRTLPAMTEHVLDNAFARWRAMGITSVSAQPPRTPAVTGSGSPAAGAAAAPARGRKTAARPSPMARTQRRAAPPAGARPKARTPKPKRGQKHR